MLYRLLRCQTENQAVEVARRFPAVTFGGQKLLTALRLKDGAAVPLRRIKERLHQCIYHHTSVILDDQLVLLLDPGHLGGEAMRTLSSLAEEWRFQAAMSIPFQDMSFIPCAYRQVEICLGMGYAERSPCIIRFEDRMMAYAAQACLKEQPLAFYIHPIVTRIREYDRVYHVNYLETLRAYIYAAGNLKATACNLDVHYNTVKYRMSVIEDIAGQPIREHGALLAVLYFSLLMEDIGELRSPVIKSGGATGVKD